MPTERVIVIVNEEGHVPSQQGRSSRGLFRGGQELGGLRFPILCRRVEMPVSRARPPHHFCETHQCVHPPPLSPLRETRHALSGRSQVGKVTAKRQTTGGFVFVCRVSRAGAGQSERRSGCEVEGCEGIGWIGFGPVARFRLWKCWWLKCELLLLLLRRKGCDRICRMARGRFLRALDFALALKFSQAWKGTEGRNCAR